MIDEISTLSDHHLRLVRARQSFREKLTDLEFFEEFKSRSELTEEEALELGKKSERIPSRKVRGEFLNELWILTSFFSVDKGI